MRTVAIVGANLLLYPLASRIDRLHFEAGREVPPTNYQFEVVCQATAVDAVRETVIDLLSTPAFRIRSVGAYSAVAPGEVKCVPRCSAAHETTHTWRRRCG